MTLSDPWRLDGRVALVTGAAGKLGPIWVSALIDAGARVVGVDLSDADVPESDAYVHEIASVNDRAALEAVRERVAERWGAPTILVCGAGIDQPPSATADAVAIEDMPVEEFTGTIDVNLAGTFQTIQVFGPAMSGEGGGSIVTIGSLYAGIAPDPSFYDHLRADPPFLKPPAYGASKAGVVSLTRYFARLWGPQGVRVNCLSPGGVAGGQDSEFLRKYTARVPLGRMAESDDLRAPLVFLASDASAYMTGHELKLDGGFTA